ncbi:unnamed protein product [Arabis nemorensis]|uniref:CCT domain-containing protein n=1 Tax=Arabis nemorensis TaxID=586526 RepID=A0A565C7B1_9BRAS|nr:unnamed protein product [Arabis nemorensis]
MIELGNNPGPLDAASLCTACDSEIRSANPLARRHQRVPILPISGNSYSSMANNHSSETTVTTDPENRLVVGQEEDEDEAEAASCSSMDKQFTDQSNEYHQGYNVPQGSYGGDGVVPLQVELKGHMHHEQYDFQFGFTMAPQEIIKAPPMVPQVICPMDREARVLRYNEKKKMRKFEKTIRYASRKAYAETRPRIKGRFAKRKEADAEADQAFSTMIMFDT